MIDIEILHRDALGINGQCPQPVAYECQEPQHILIKTAKELFSILVGSTKGKQTLLSIANECERLVGTNSINLEILVQTFIDAMTSDANFPVIIADDAYAANILGGLSNGGGILGGEVRFHNFEILINRPRVEQMVGAQARNSLDLNVYQIQLACTILRCAGEIFVQYLAHEMCNLTPLNGAAQVCPFRSVIEGAGVKLESGIFGSEISWFKDPSLSDPQPGQPFLANLDSEGRVMDWTPLEGQYTHNLANHVYEYPAVAVGPIIARGVREPLFT